MVEPYAHAPVTEAVIEFRLRETLSAAALRKSRERIAPNYDVIEDLIEFQIEARVGSPPPPVKQKPSGFKARSSDAVDVISSSPLSLAVSRTAPYLGWEPFFERVQRDHDLWVKAVGRHALQRVGARFINRLDIPTHDAPTFSASDYVQVGTHFPVLPFPFMNVGFLSQNALTLPLEQIGVTLSAGTMPPELLGHSALMLDIDVFQTIDVPAEDADMWVLLRRFREIKNSVFEFCVTDQARELFK